MSLTGAQRSLGSGPPRMDRRCPALRWTGIASTDRRYGDPARRPVAEIARDVARGYYTAAEAARLWPHYAEAQS